MANAKIEAWIKGAVGRGMNRDGAYGYQCVDVIDDYGQVIFNKPWPTVVGYADAKDLYRVMPTTYWKKIKNNPDSSAQIPIRGDVIVWPSNNFSQFGHTAVVTKATQAYVYVIQQDGNNSTKPAHTKRLPYVLGGQLPIGWCRPKLDVITKKTIKTETSIPFSKETVKDASKLVGVSKITQPGVNGIKTTTISVTYTNGKETARKTLTSEVTTKPIPQVTLVGTKTIEQDIHETVKANNNLLKQILEAITSLISKITSIFK